MSTTGAKRLTHDVTRLTHYA